MKTNKIIIFTIFSFVIINIIFLSIIWYCVHDEYHKLFVIKLIYTCGGVKIINDEAIEIFELIKHGKDHQDIMMKEWPILDKLGSVGFSESNKKSVGFIQIARGGHSSMYFIRIYDPRENPQTLHEGIKVLENIFIYGKKKFSFLF